MTLRTFYRKKWNSRRRIRRKKMKFLNLFFSELEHWEQPSLLVSPLDVMIWSWYYQKQEFIVLTSFSFILFLYWVYKKLSDFHHPPRDQTRCEHIITIKFQLQTAIPPSVQHYKIPLSKHHIPCSITTSLSISVFSTTHLHT